MTDLISADQITQIRDAFNDISETFEFPITLIRTAYETDTAYGTDANTEALSASGTVTYGAVSPGDTLVVNGTGTFTAVASSPGATEFSTVAELTALIDALSIVSATLTDDEITITATTAGEDGNDITLAVTGTGLTLSGATLTGGRDSAEIDFKAIREFVSQGDSDQFRNPLGPEATHVWNLWIGWQKCEDAGIIDDDNKVLIDDNDLVRMEGEIYEIVSFAGVADMTKKPAFLFLQIRRRFENPNGAASI